MHNIISTGPPQAHSAATPPSPFFGSDSEEQHPPDEELVDFELGTIHSFSRALKEEGYVAAILLKYLAYRVFYSRKQIRGKKWTYETLDELASRYPYLSRSAIDRALRQVQGSILEIDTFNKRAGDRTRWYAFVDETWLKTVNSQLVYFRVDDAVKYGVPTAVVLRNITYWVGRNWVHQPGYEWHRFSATEMAEKLPFSKTVILKALKTLAGVELERRECPGWDRAHEYRLVHPERFMDPTLARGHPAHLHGSDWDIHGRKWDIHGVNRNTHGVIRDMHGVDRDSVTCWRTIGDTVGDADGENSLTEVTPACPQEAQLSPELLAHLGDKDRRGDSVTTTHCDNGSGGQFRTLDEAMAYLRSKLAPEELDRLQNTPRGLSPSFCDLFLVDYANQLRARDQDAPLGISHVE